jgi:arylsulfatase A-like enzyme
VKWIAKKSKRARVAVIGLAICSAAALMLVPTTSGAADPIFADDFSSGGFANWTGMTRLTIDNTTGGVAAPSARAQVTGQSAWAFKTLSPTRPSLCVSMNLNLASVTGTAVVLLRLRTASNGPVTRVFASPAGVDRAAGLLWVKSDVSGTQVSSGAILGTGWHSIELCGTVGTNSTWDLYRDGVKIVNAWPANTGTTPIGRIEIGDATAKTFTINFDDVLLDLAPGQGPVDTTPPTAPGKPSGVSNSSSTIDLTWAAAVDETSTSLTYRVSRDGTQIATVTSASTTTVSFQDTGLTASSTHTYSVVAVDQANNAGPPSPTSDQITVQAGAPPGNRPNILLIVTDDQRMAADTMMVMPKTSALFMDQGTNFPNGYVTTPLCCPSRSTIHSGRYAHNTHVLTNGDLDATLAYDQSATTQRYLHDAGYQTAIVGKFLTNWPVERNPSYFDRWSIFAGQYWAANYNIDGTMRQINGYTTDVLGNQADGILQSFESQDSKPWFLYLAPHAPHSNYTPNTQYQNAAVPPWTPGPAFLESDVSDKPPAVKWRTYSLAAAQSLRASQLRTLMSVDDMVQQVFNQLQALGETNTLAIFMSDNGFLWGEHRIGGNKRFPYSESIKVPLMMRWPGHIAAGASDPRFAANVDITPTILDAAGVTPQLVYPLDGHSLLSSYARNRMLLEYWLSPDATGIPTWASIRTATYQYVEWYSTDNTTVTFREYYNLVNDPDELVNLLGDGNPANDPNIAPLAAQLAADRACSGSSCP